MTVGGVLAIKTELTGNAVTTTISTKGFQRIGVDVKHLENNTEMMLWTENLST